LVDAGAAVVAAEVADDGEHAANAAENAAAKHRPAYRARLMNRTAVRS
jgi:hypothetical protein